MYRLQFELTPVIAGGVVAMMLLMSARTAHSQMVTNPRYVVFAPSPDHYSATSSGAPVVLAYLLEIYPYDASQPLAVVNLGKQDPGPDGYVAVNFADLLPDPPATEMMLQGVVAAVGPGGTSRSGRSDMFTFNSCTYSVSPTSVAISSAGGTAPSSVSTAAECGWLASSNDSWIGIASASSGFGSAGVIVGAAPNPDPYERSGTVSVGTAVIVVKQSAATLGSTSSLASDAMSSAPSQ
jgi:hypothetical protein